MLPILMNTSNKGKQKEFMSFLNLKMQFTDHDLEEPLSDQETIVAYKIGRLLQLHPGVPVMCEDTALYIENADVGVNIRSKLDTLKKYEGSKATFVCLIGYCEDGQVVKFYQGSVTGTIVPPRGDAGFGFDSVFEVDGLTLAEDKSLCRNARYVACQNFLQETIHDTRPVVFDWNGKYQ
jgi:XTP/dITP diphosphohydrolase